VVLAVLSMSFDGLQRQGKLAGLVLSAVDGRTAGPTHRNTVYQLLPAVLLPVLAMVATAAVATAVCFVLLTCANAPPSPRA
jgi:hypothetical protein